MKYKKTLTISIASYNAEKSIKRTIDSLLVSDKYMNQLEIIIVNDGSKDKTREIAETYKKMYPNTFVVINKQNAGYGSTINESIKIAHGKYYKLLDADDRFITENLEEYLDFLNNCKSNLVYTPFVIHENTKTIKIDSFNNITKNSNSLLIKNSNVYLLHMHEITIETKVLKENNVSIEERCFYTDMEFSYFCLKYSNTISKYNKFLYEYYKDNNGQSVSINGIQKHYKDMIKVFYNLADDYINSNYVDNYKRKLIDEIVKNSCYSVYRNFIILGSKYKEDIINYDDDIKSNYRIIYNLTNDNIKYRALRIIKFKYIWILHIFLSIKGYV